MQITMKRILRKMHRLFLEIVSKFFIIFPIKHNRIVFNNFFGNGFGDNPKYIAEELIKTRSFDLYWITNNKNIILPHGIKPIQSGSFIERFILSTCKMRVSNIRNYFPVHMRKKQLYLQTWHGVGAFKKIEGECINKLHPDYIKLAKYEGTICNGIISGDAIFSKCCKNYFFLSSKCSVLEYGLPRNDVLINGSKDKKYVASLRKKYNINNNSYVVLYAPTFREHTQTKTIDFNAIANTIEKRIRNKCIVLIRLHPNNEQFIVNYSFDDNIRNGNFIKDSQEIVLISNMCITDYSGIVSDFSIIDKPFLMYVEDEKTYEEERGFTERYLLMDDHKCYNIEQLHQKLKTMDLFYAKNDKINTFDDGNATHKVCNWIVNQTIAKH